MVGPARQRRRLLARVGDLALTLLAVGGTVCVVLVPLAFFFDISLILFKTGSMSPSIPAGSLAVVREIPASEVVVGDVVTVDRSPLAPITHRVVEIADGGGSTRLLTLRGDANDSNDTAPYAVTHVRLVEWSAPRLGYAVRTVSNVYAMSAITISTAAIVTWAFWPRSEPRPPARHRRTGPDGATPDRETDAHPSSTLRCLLLAVAVLPGVTAAVLAAPSPARADPTEEVIRSRYLTLVSIGDEARMTTMSPEEPVPWQVGVSAHAPQPGTVTISLSASGPLAARPDGLQVTAAVCPQRWVKGGCPTGQEKQVLADGPATRLTTAPITIDSMRADQQRWVLVTASLLAGATAAGSADLVVTATGFGDRASAGGTVGPLPRTGPDLRTPLAVGAGALLAGLLLVLAVRRRRIRVGRP
ncbi:MULTISPECIES: signal peptidase I [unclassified Micromonospora]|uniref:signal peptidase I n=1 Tax=unclassified Micromonospora TaxID=2617518 RepID=UPI0010334FD5|nr:signal peptidase I [Verrucosispora sp. SN26_14.1]TBL36021.1 signal peptidase I [Verrucosispora sp. SN26_14.1]